MCGRCRVVPVTLCVPATPPAGTTSARPKQSPGATAGRVGLGERARLCREHCERDAPPGSAGVSPACTAVAYRAERLRWCTGQPRGQERREPGQSRALARLPVESGWRRRARLSREHCGRDAPPGSAGVSPACTAVAYRAERLRWCTGQPRGQERREPGQSRALARLPVESRWRGRAGLSREHCERDAPPGSAGVSPAYTAVAYRAERLRWCTGQPRRQERREPVQSRALARLPVESRWRRRAKLSREHCERDARAPGWASRSGRYAPSTGQRADSATFGAQNPAIFNAH